jgi:hypothetical protein
MRGTGGEYPASEVNTRWRERAPSFDARRRALANPQRGSGTIFFAFRVCSIKRFIVPAAT